jgi:hypothetical protein
MGSAVFPAPSAGGGIKSVQRGLAGSSGNVTITAVDISKSFVNIYGTASSGTVAASGAISAASGTASAHTVSIPQTTIGRASNFWDQPGSGETPRGSQNGSNGTPSGLDSTRSEGILPAITANTAAQNISLNAQNISGGSTNLVSAVVQGYLSDSTTLVVSGACRWEVVEFA